MIKYLKQNKQVVIASFTLFILSMSTLFFFLGTNQELERGDYKADLMHGSRKHFSLIIEEKKYREIVQNTVDPLVVLNMDGEIDFISQNFEVKSGYDREEILHKTFSHFLHSDDLTTFLEHFVKAIETKETVVMVGPFRFLDKDGKYRTHIISFIPLEEKGVMYAIAMTAKDISSSKGQEEGQDNPIHQDKNNEKDERLMAEN